jgi:lactam utilization protein B
MPEEYLVQRYATYSNCAILELIQHLRERQHQVLQLPLSTLIVHGDSEEPLVFKQAKRYMLKKLEEHIRDLKQVLIFRKRAK